MTNDSRRGKFRAVIRRAFAPVSDLLRRGGAASGEAFRRFVCFFDRVIAARIDRFSAYVFRGWTVFVQAYVTAVRRLPSPLAWLFTRRLFGYYVFIVLIFFGYHIFAANVSAKTDASLFGWLCGVLVLCVIGMVLATPEWTMRALGVKSLLIGFALIYFLVFARVFGFAMHIVMRREYIEIVRSFALATAFFLGPAAVRYLWQNRFRPPAWWQKDHPDVQKRQQRPEKFLDV